MPDRHKLRRPALGIFASLQENVPGSFSFRWHKIPKTMAAFETSQKHQDEIPQFKFCHQTIEFHHFHSFTPSLVFWLLALLPTSCWGLLPVGQKVSVSVFTWRPPTTLIKICRKSQSFHTNSKTYVHCYHIKEDAFFITSYMFHAVLHTFESVWSPHWFQQFSHSRRIRIKPTPEDPNHHVFPRSGCIRIDIMGATLRRLKACERIRLQKGKLTCECF